MSEIVKFPINSCSSCGAPTNQKIELLNFDTGENTGVKYLCPKCQPLDEDGLRLLVDKKDREIAALRKALKQIADLGWDDDDPEYEIAREALRVDVGSAPIPSAPDASAPVRRPRE